MFSAFEFLIMDKTELRSQWDKKCAHCSAWCKGQAGVSLHFLTDHLLNYWHSNSYSCPFCISDDSSMMHIFMQHQSACIFCLEDVSASTHTECHENVAKAAEVMARNLVSMYLFSSRTSVSPISPN